MSDSCLFCKIIKGEVPSKMAFETDQIYAFHDIIPQAKTHILVVHKKHSANVVEMSKDPQSLVEVFTAISEYAHSSGLEKTGFRIVTNCGPDAGQTVFHTHFHILGGEELKRFGN
jgi:histidine triad (HIT) family protein